MTIGLLKQPTIPTMFFKVSSVGSGKSLSRAILAPNAIEIKAKRPLQRARKSLIFRYEQPLAKNIFHP